MNKNKTKVQLVLAGVLLIIALIGLFTFDINPVVAQREAGSDVLPLTDADQPVGSPESFTVAPPLASIVKMVSALIVVIFCVYIGLFLLKRLMAARVRRNGQENLLEVIQSTYVGPKKSVSLLRVADRSVLIGVTDQSISVLTELDAEETAAILVEKPRVESEAGFGSFLRTAANSVSRISLKRHPAAQEG